MLDKAPFAISILGMIAGVSIAILFGVNEDFFKGRISDGLLQNEKIMAIESDEEREAKLETEAEKNWRYYQRFHFHSTGIGAMTLATLLLTLHIPASRTLLFTTRYMLSLGGFFYPFVWLFAGMYGPTMGRSEAKEAFAIFGYAGGLVLTGLLLAAYLLLRYGLMTSIKEYSS